MFAHSLFSFLVGNLSGCGCIGNLSGCDCLGVWGVCTCAWSASCHVCEGSVIMTMVIIGTWLLHCLECEDRLLTCYDFERCG